MVYVIILKLVLLERCLVVFFLDLDFVFVRNIVGMFDCCSIFRVFFVLGIVFWFFIRILLIFNKILKDCIVVFGIGFGVGFLYREWIIFIIEDWRVWNFGGKDCRIWGDVI